MSAREPHYSPTAVLINKPLPADEDAEAALLGSILCDVSVLGDVTQILNGPDDMQDIRHRMLYQFLLGFASRRHSNLHLDSVILLSELRSRGILEEVGGVDYIVDLIDFMPNAENAIHYARLVSEAAKRRRIILTGHRLIGIGYESVGTMDEVLSEAQHHVIAMLCQKDRAQISSLSEAMADLITDIGEYDESKPIGASTGIPDLDKLILGIEKGLVYVIGARPSVGKTTLAIQLMLSVGLVSKWRVLFFSLETGKITAARRYAAQLAQIPLWVLRRKKLTQKDWQCLADAQSAIEECDIQIVDCPSASAFDIRAMVVREHARRPVDMVVVDYLQLVSFPDAKSRENEVASVSRGLKALARELNIAVIELSQLNRQGDDRPRTKDLRDSGQIEQDADNIWLLHRPDQAEAGQEYAKFTNEAELIVAKQKDGETGTVHLTFNPASVRFEPVPSGEDEVPQSLMYEQEVPA